MNPTTTYPTTTYPYRKLDLNVRRALIAALLILIWPAMAVEAWYPDDSMYSCDWRFIDGPREGQSGIEQRWIMTNGSTSKKTGITRMRWPGGGTAQQGITLTKTSAHGPNQWRAKVGGITCEYFTILDSNRYEFRACSNGAELDCTRHSSVRGGTYKVVPVITSSGVFDANEGDLKNPRGFMYFTAAGSQKTGSFGDYSCISNECYPSNVWASNFQGPVLKNSGDKIQWEWSIDQIGDNYWVKHLCPGQCDNLCANSPLCTTCQVNHNLYCPNAAQEQTGTYVSDFKRSQISKRSYPYMWGVQVKNSPNLLQPTKVRVKEHDPGFWDSDDKVGAFTLDPLACQLSVWGRGRFSDWATGLRANGEPYDGKNDIEFVDFKLWCEFNIDDPGWVL